MNISQRDLKLISKALNYYNNYLNCLQKNGQLDPDRVPEFGRIRRLNDDIEDLILKEE